MPGSLAANVPHAIRDSTKAGVLDREGRKADMVEVIVGPRFQPGSGNWPVRLFLDERRKMMLVADEEGDNVAGFRVEASGTLTPSGLNVAFRGPAFLFHPPPAAP